MGSASSRGGVGGGSASSDEAIDARKGNQNGGKRKLEEERVETSPKRRKIQTTSSYIYDTMFIRGTDSDITIAALGKQWKLHKVYLSQSPYFSSMFSGNWVESNQPFISLEIPDSTITTDALDLAFSSLYKDEVTLKPEQIKGAVAVATMLQLEGLLDHCHEYMKETLSSDTVITYLDTASQYGLHDIAEEAQFWLETHLLTTYSVTLLKLLSPDLFRKLIRSPSLFIMQVEMDLYTIAKKWLFLRMCPDWSGNLHQLTTNADAYFKEEGSNGFFLESKKGEPYVEVFQAIRLEHIVVDYCSVEVLEADKIIPSSWLQPLYRQQWLRTLLVDQRLDQGPSQLSDADFTDVSVRCGRVLYEPGEYCWRWTGFSYGVDVLINYSNKVFSVKRNTQSQPCLSAVSLQNEREVVIRLKVVSFLLEGGVASSQDTGMLVLRLAPDETTPILTLSEQAHFPLFISANLSLTSSTITRTQ